MAKHEKNLHGILAGPKYQVSVPPLFNTENVEGKETLRKKATRRAAGRNSSKPNFQLHTFNL